MRNTKDHGMKEHGESEEYICQMKDTRRGLICSSYYNYLAFTMNRLACSLNGPCSARQSKESKLTR